MNTTPTTINGLDDVSGCPTGPRCLTCGTADRSVLSVHTVDLAMLGVGCVTVCHADRDAGRLPPLGVPAAAELVAEHCGHLGITLDRMAELLAGDR